VNKSFHIELPFFNLEQLILDNYFFWNNLVSRIFENNICPACIILQKRMMEVKAML